MNDRAVWIIGNTARSPDAIGTESECHGEWETGERMAVLVPGAGPSPTHYHANNDVCWYIMSGRIRCIQARSDCSNRKELILEAGDFVYVPSGAM
jgi:mannose-6-phosphate isomerase-like protein (cupin superfamily)